MLNLIRKIVGTKNDRELKRILPLVERINRLEPSVAALSDAALRARTGEFRQRVENGEMAAVWLHGEGEVTLKHFYQEEDGRVRLQPANPTMAPIYVDDPGQVVVQGKVVMVIRKLD